MSEVQPGGHQRSDRVLAADYVCDLDTLSLTTLRERRDEADQEETDLSYLRRLLHARIDIVQAEQSRRTSGKETTVIDQLSTILAQNSLGPAAGSGRHQTLEPSQSGIHRRQAETLVGDAELSDVASLSDTQLTETLDRFRAQESSVSERRRKVQTVVDTFNAEIARRYAHGSASVDELLASERARDGQQ